MGETLTDAEIAEIRRYSREWASACPWFLGDIDRLLDEVGRARALLGRLEWSGVTDEGEKYCLECGAILIDLGDVLPRHRPGCEHAALLRR